MRALDITRELTLTRKQRAAVEFRAPLIDGEPQIETVGFLGEYGGGKTFAHVIRLVLIALEHPFIYGEHASGDEPSTGLVAPTHGDLKKGLLREFYKIVPEELIYREIFYGDDQHIQLSNGHKFLLYSAEGAMNGPSLVQVGADELQERCFALKWENIRKRVRDKRARRPSVSASGIAQRGHVESFFRKPNTETQMHVLLFPEDNARNMARGYVDREKARMPASRVRDKDGWLLPQGAMFPRFSRQRHVRMPPGMERVRRDELRGKPTSFSVDMGRLGAIVFGQPLTGLPVHPQIDRKTGRLVAGDGRGILIVDHLMPDNSEDAKEICALIKRKAQWRIVAGQSVICLDPSVRPDQLTTFRSEFPGVEIIYHPRGPYHEEDVGFECVNRALLDQHDDVRFYVLPELEVSESTRGVVESMSNYLATKMKDKWYEHAADGVRYITQQFVPSPALEHEMDPEIQKRIDQASRPLGAGLNESNMA